MKSRELSQIKCDYNFKNKNSLKRYEIRNIIQACLSQMKKNLHLIH